MLLGQQGSKPRVQQRLFVRGLTHSGSEIAAPDAAEAALLKSLDELELAFLEKRVASRRLG